MVKFQIASDLHIEYRDEEKIPLSDYIVKDDKTDILILAGDIGNMNRFNQLKYFLQQACSEFRYVIYVPGNHEYYFKTKEEKVSLSYGQITKLFRLLENEIEGLLIIHNQNISIGNICICGSTLWSKPERRIPNYIVRIKGIDTKRYSKLFKESVEHIKQTIDFCSFNKMDLLVVTHHSPTYTLLDENRLEDNYVSLYASHLDHLLEKEKVHTWVCGHIHKNFDLISKGGTRLYGNQKGKPKDNITEYRKTAVIEI